MKKIFFSIILLVSFLSLITYLVFYITSNNSLFLTDKKSHQKMIDQLNKSKNLKNKYSSDKWAILYQKKYDEYSSDRKKASIAKNLFQSLLYSGEAQKSIVILNALIAYHKFDLTIATKKNHFILRKLGLAYLRLGEEQNCIDCKFEGACIIPLKKSALHINKTGSNKAIEIYSKILKSFPKDLETRWLLNIAYMTVGKYPHNVPKSVLIPDIFKSKTNNIAQFTNVSKKIGVDVKGLAGGIVFEDLNGDNFLDLFVTSYKLTNQVEVFFNDKNGGYIHQTPSSNLIGITGGFNAIQADYNNDGNEDILILRGAWLEKQGHQYNSLIKNLGNGTFIDTTFKANLITNYPTQTAAWADFNLDGWIDLVIGNEHFPSELYVNNKNSTFKKLDASSGFDENGLVKGIITGDINNDRLPDIFISKLNGKNKLLLNVTKKNQPITFKDISESSGIQFPLKSFTTWFWDFDNDGYEDIFVASRDTERNIGYLRSIEFLLKSDPNKYSLLRNKYETLKIYKNNGNLTFTDMADQLGLNQNYYIMGANYGDINNDGFLDFYIGTGTPSFKALTPNRLFLNQNGNSFTDITFQTGVGHLQKGHGIAFGDYDNDGDQDIYAVMGGMYYGDAFRNIFFENPGINKLNAYIKLKLVGTNSNRSAIGARIKCNVTSDKNQEKTIYKTISSGASFGSHSFQQLIGLGNIKRLNYIEILWPSFDKKISRFTNLSPNNTYKITENNKVYLLNKHNIWSLI